VTDPIGGESPSNPIGPPQKDPDSSVGKAFWRRLLQLDDTPESIAMGTAVGMFVAWTPTVGIQIVMVLILALAIPMNRIAALIMIYISNPLTMVPMYYLEYVVGLTLLGRDGMSYDEFLELCNVTIELARQESYWSATLTFFRELGYPILTALIVGGTVIGALTAVPTYPLTLNWIRKYRERGVVNSGDGVGESASREE